MPPCLDIYVVTRHRTRATVHRFIDEYVDRAASEDRGDEELMMLPFDFLTQDPPRDSWQWEPARTLSHVVERGLDKPPRAFAVYLKSQSATLDRVILAFTTDDQVVFGASIDDSGGEPQNLDRAKLLLQELASAFSADSGFVGVEMPPPLFGALDVPTGHELILYQWKNDAVNKRIGCKSSTS